LTAVDARRLARNAIFDDGTINESDIPQVMQAKHTLLSGEGVLSFEFDTAKFSEVGGLRKLKGWLEERRSVFNGGEDIPHLDPPKGLLLLGVQGGGKSLAAKAVAGMWQVPLLRLDFAAIYNKYHGETERQLRESINTAEAMAPCVLWIDEIEKGISVGDSDGGTSKRVLGTLLTWMAEKRSSVFLVATANNIEHLPPELMRKGRFDEIFFVDLPSTEVRQEIFAIHLEKRGQSAGEFETEMLARQSLGFSGAEIEQAIVAALYASHTRGQSLTTRHILEEINKTRPLSHIMRERIERLRQWAAERTVASD
jgi:SpoVK/Ycf46/Vps4 family AAA+-type ATPase